MGAHTFLVLGGDKRQLYAARRFAERGYAVHICAVEGSTAQLEQAAGKAESVVLPLPVTRNGIHLNAPLCMEKITLERVLASLNHEHTVFAGMLSNELKNRFLEGGIVCYDYFTREEFAILNSVATAEGVVMEAIAAMPVNIFGSCCAVAGFGKTGRQAARLLRAMGAEVTVVARRRRDAALAFADGCSFAGFDELKQLAHRFDLLVNTVPVQLIGSKILSALKKECVLIEVASAPYGIDADYAQSAGLRVIFAPSLPGRVSPKTSGEIIADTVISIVKEGV